MKNLKRISNSVKFHQMWLFVVFMTFLVYGGYTLSKNIYKKVLLMSRIKNVTHDLNSKADKLIEHKEMLQSVDEYVEILDEQVSPNFLLADYLVDLAVACGKSGYVLERFNPRETSVAGNYAITISLMGNGDPVVLTASVESLKRVTNIENMRISFGESTNSIDMSINVLSGNGL